MNKRIRSMIDEIFSEMKMTAENLALRDELMANAQARFEDCVAQGSSEEAAFAQVAESLEDVQGLLEEMNRLDHVQQPCAQEDEEAIPELKTLCEEPESAQDQAHEAHDQAQEAKGEQKADLGDALNKAFSALGDFSQAIAPEAKKLAMQMNDATGGMLGKLGRAAKKGMRGAQKAAGDAIDRLSKDQGELVFDFGPKKNAQPEPEQEPEQEAGQETTQEADEAQTKTPDEAAQDHKPIIDESGEIDEDVLEQAVREAEQAASAAQTEEEYTVCDEKERISGRTSFPAAGIREIDIQLDADDVQIIASQGECVETLWEARNVEGEPAMELSGDTLRIRRRNPDVFKTFFSVFAKEGGRITVRVPRESAACYKISTTSGDVQMRGVDAQSVKINTTSGCVHLESLKGLRAQDVAVTTVSGHATVSVCAEDVAVTTVSGDQFIVCDAQSVDVNAVSGKVHAEGACESWEINAVSGDVEVLCSAVPARKVQISSMHASVRLALPQDIRGFTAEIKGPLGCELVNEFGPNRYGTCALPIRMETMRGRLTITRL